VVVVGVGCCVVEVAVEGAGCDAAPLQFRMPFNRGKGPWCVEQERLHVTQCDC